MTSTWSPAIARFEYAGVVGVAWRLRAVAVAAQVGGDDGEALGQHVARPCAT